MAAAESEIMETRNTPRGLLRIDAATPVVLHFLMPLIKPFRERYPEVTLSLVSSETIINLIERKVDVAIRAGTLTDSSLRAGRYLTVIEKLSPPRLYFPLREARNDRRFKATYLQDSLNPLPSIPADSP